MRTLIAGCGYVGCELGRRLVVRGHAVWGLRRRPDSLPEGVTAIAADLLRPENLAGLPAVDAVVYAVSADAYDEDSYRRFYVEALDNLLAALPAPPARLVYVSSTGVYGQQDGEWVDETSPTEPTHGTGRMLLAGERTAREAGPGATVLRLAGIYGPGRTRLLDSVRDGSARCVAQPPQYSNLIHRDDAAGILEHLLGLERPETLYLGADDEPVERCTLLRYLADRLGCPPPEVLAEGAPTRRHARGNKRCRNARVRAAGYAFRFPTYREGFGALIDAGV